MFKATEEHTICRIWRRFPCLVL